MIPHVLIVEDSALVVGALRVLLEETGHRVSAAATVREAAALARRDRPDLVLLDLTLGREDGLALLPLLADDHAPPPVVVAVTGHDTPEHHDRCVAAGCRDVLVKPISARELPHRIGAWLAERSAGGP